MIEINNIELSDFFDRLDDEISALWEYGIETMYDYIMSKGKELESAVKFIRNNIA